MPDQLSAQEVEEIRSQERQRVLTEVRDLAPHEVPCSCSAGGIFEHDQHADECPRGALGHVLNTLEDPEQPALSEGAGSDQGEDWPDWPEVWMVRRYGFPGFPFPHQHAGTEALAQAYVRKDAAEKIGPGPSEIRRYIPAPSPETGEGEHPADGRSLGRLPASDLATYLFEALEEEVVIEAGVTEAKLTSVLEARLEAWFYTTCFGCKKRVEFDQAKGWSEAECGEGIVHYCPDCQPPSPQRQGEGR